MSEVLSDDQIKKQKNELMKLLDSCLPINIVVQSLNHLICEYLYSSTLLILQKHNSHFITVTDAGQIFFEKVPICAFKESSMKFKLSSCKLYSKWPITRYFFRTFYKLEIIGSVKRVPSQFFHMTSKKPFTEMYAATLKKTKDFYVTALFSLPSKYMATDEEFKTVEWENYTGIREETFKDPRYQCFNKRVHFETKANSKPIFTKITPQKTEEKKTSTENTRPEAFCFSTNGEILYVLTKEIKLSVFTMGQCGSLELLANSKIQFWDGKPNLPGVVVDMTMNQGSLVILCTKSLTIVDPASFTAIYQIEKKCHCGHIASLLSITPNIRSQLISYSKKKEKEIQKEKETEQTTETGKNESEKG